MLLVFWSWYKNNINESVVQRERTSFFARVIRLEDNCRNGRKTEWEKNKGKMGDRKNETRKRNEKLKCWATCVGVVG